MEDFDGIQHDHEHYKSLPLGWFIFFIGVIVWGIWYMFVHVPIWSWSQADVYKEKVKAESVKKAAMPAVLANPYKGSAHELEEGKALYSEHCAACHGDNAEGGIAPPLAGVSEYIYGGNDKDLYESVMEGRPGGMPPFKATLGGKKVWEVLAYIDSLELE